MVKGYILVDVPDNCKLCQFYFKELKFRTGDLVIGCSLKRNANISDPDNKPDCCPIREFPKKKEPSVFPVSPLLPWQNTDYEKGWNACLDFLDGK